MRRPRGQPDDLESPEGWTDDETPEKYDAMTMGDNADQDDEETLAVQSDAREEVEPRSPSLRTRGSSPRRANADTREDAGAELDDPNGAAAEVNTPQPPRAKRGSGRPTSSKAFAGKSGKTRSASKKAVGGSARAARSTRKNMTSKRSTRTTASKKNRSTQSRTSTRKGRSRGR